MQKPASPDDAGNERECLWHFIALEDGPDIPLPLEELLIIGRHPTCEEIISSLRMSRIHVAVIRLRDCVLVRDLLSTNGISVNDQRVNKARMRPGDTIKIAHFLYRLSDQPEGNTSDLETGGHQLIGDEHVVTNALRSLGMLGKGARVQVVIQVQPPNQANAEVQEPKPPLDSPPEPPANAEGHVPDA